MYPAMATEWMTGQQQAKCFIKYEVGQTSRGKTNGIKQNNVYGCNFDVWTLKTAYFCKKYCLIGFWDMCCELLNEILWQLSLKICMGK